MTASNKQSVELNTMAGKDDDIIATSISEVLPLPQSPSKSILSKSAFEDTPLSTAGSSATPKPTPAQDKLTADIDTLTKKIEWHKSDKRENALKHKHRLQNQAEQKKKLTTRRNSRCKNSWRKDRKSQLSCFDLQQLNELGSLRMQIMKVCFILLKK